MMAFLRWCWAMSLKLFMLVMPVELCLFALLPTDLDPFLKLEGSFCNIHSNSYNSSFWRSVSRVFFFLVCLCFALLLFFTLLMFCLNAASVIPGGKMLKDEETLESLGLKNGSRLYFKDLGPQVGWTTVWIFHHFFNWCGDTRSCQVSNWVSSGCALIPP